jgi:hypothetical protein
MAVVEEDRTNHTVGVLKYMLIVGLLFVSIPAYRFDGIGKSPSSYVILSSVAQAEDVVGSDDAGARKAFLEAYMVFMHPRCMNCHPAGDVPLQGDDSRAHDQNVKRGRDGSGRYALKCVNCHQQTNLKGENMPPGAPTWLLPPPDMPMVFQGKTPGELCRLQKDPLRNGGKTLEELIKHISEDKLVLWGWDPGDGRTRPPLSHAQFAQKMREWVTKGAACPDF